MIKYGVFVGFPAVRLWHPEAWEPGFESMNPPHMTGGAVITQPGSILAVFQTLRKIFAATQEKAVKVLAKVLAFTIIKAAWSVRGVSLPLALR
jgi:hypothetical protein